MNMKWSLVEITETVEELKAIMHSQISPFKVFQDIVK